MKIDLYAFCYQDGNFLPFFLRYYRNLVNSMIFIDSNSTDNSLSLIKAYGGKIIQTNHKIWDWDAGQIILQNVWRESTADWVFFPNIDEIFYHPQLKTYLEDRIGKVDIFQMRGFQMVAQEFPKQGTDILEIKKGVPNSLYNKFSIFNPKANITFVNAHDIRTTSTKLDRGNIKLLHYRYLGVKEQLRRAALVKKRVPCNSFCKGIGGNILQKYPGLIRTKEVYQLEIDELLSKAVRVI